MRVFVILIFILILIISIDMYWGLDLAWVWAKSNASVLGTFFTAFAFVATIWSAHEGRRSSTAAIKASNISEESLKLSGKISAVQTFESHYSLLLEQHNIYHEKLCEYLDSKVGRDLLNNIQSKNNVYLACRQLYTHPVISPYMRVLYHTLDFVSTSYYNENGDVSEHKKYTSLIRSLIRNDILSLVGLNALIMKEKNPGENYGFEYYQQLLHKYDFFEHVNFISWAGETTLDDGCNELSKKYESLIYEHAKSLIKLRISQVANNKIGASSIYFKKTPVKLVLIYVYKNPFSGKLNELINKTPKDIFSIFNCLWKNNAKETDFALQKSRGLNAGLLKRKILSELSDDLTQMKKEFDSFKHI
ncbi:putative phage abortive infection protein [Pantoea sp. FN0307]|uniref:putative phage abortive infection protein n=1 Tax=Pantoea sp. FN0307 TaxID=3418560 RepID=UPI003CF8C0DA